MAGINLSQSITEKQVQEPQESKKGTYLVLGLFALTLLSWGGVTAANSVYDKKIEQQNSLIASKKTELSGEMVNEVADVDARLSLVEANIAARVHPQAILLALEGALLPAVRLTAFEYDDKTRGVTLTGVAPGYKEIAQQVMALKSSVQFAETDIVSLAKEKDASSILFTFESKWVEPKNK